METHPKPVEEDPGRKARLRRQFVDIRDELEVFEGSPAERDAAKKLMAAMEYYLKQTTSQTSVEDKLPPLSTQTDLPS